MSSNALSIFWTRLGVICLLISGGLSVLVTGAKIPGMKAYLGSDLHFVRWSLVQHVNLATLVWFTSIPLGLLHGSMTRKDLSKTPLYVQIGTGLSMVGLFFMMITPPFLSISPILSNYIPVLDHWIYGTGIALYLTGIGVNHLYYIITPQTLADCDNPSDPFRLVRFGMWVGSAYYLAAMITFLYSFISLRKEEVLPRSVYFDIGMWGGGHLLQHSSAVFLVACWTILLFTHASAHFVTRSKLATIFGSMMIPLLIFPIFLFNRPATDAFRNGFTELMRWGIAPPMIFFLVLVWRDNKKKLHPSLMFSFLLLIQGIVFGMFIRGQDLRIPGHYHSTIGAITLGLMAITHWILIGNLNSVRFRIASYTYGVGQMLFSSGMFIAGSFGIGRKTYGSEHEITNLGQSIGMGGLAIGGTIALVGGVLYAASILPGLKKRGVAS